MDARILICTLFFCVIRRLWRWFLMCFAHIKNQAWLVIYVRSTLRTEHGLLYMCEARQEQSMACYKIRVKKQIEYGKIILYFILWEK